MKRLIWVTMLFILITIPLLASCQNIVAVPESPFSAKYVVKQWSSELPSLVATTDTLPKEAGDSIRITNYWVLRYDDEGNAEWLRRDEDYYYIILPIGDGVITVRQIKVGQIDEIIHTYEGNK